jgi:hypothetical protein
MIKRVRTWLRNSKAHSQKVRAERRAWGTIPPPPRETGYVEGLTIRATPEHGRTNLKDK